MSNSTNFRESVVSPVRVDLPTCVWEVVNSENEIIGDAGYRFVILDISDAKVRAQIESLELGTYSASYGGRWEGQEYFEHLYPGLSDSDHGDICHVGIVSSTGELAAFFSIFQAYTFIFDSNRTAAFTAFADGISGGGSSLPPIFVVRKLARDPNFGRQLIHDWHAPHQVILGKLLQALSRLDPAGFLLETRAQPDTMRLITRRSGDHIKWNIIANIEDHDSKDDGYGLPRIILLHAPKQ